MTKVARQIRVEGSVAYVPLTQGYEAIIDASEAAAIMGVNWRAQVMLRSDGSIMTVYGCRSDNRANGRKNIYIHRLVLSAPAGFEVDHIDGDGLNNLRSNLRLVTKQQNMQNARLRSDSRSGLKGVFWDQQRGKWKAQIAADGRTQTLGRFATSDEAAAAYARASKELHGSFGRLE